MKLRYVGIASFWLFTNLLFTVPAHATTVNGTSNFLGNVTFSETSIQFAPTFVTTFGAQETGSFTGLTGGTIQSLNGGPTTGSLPVPRVAFINFTGGVATPITFDLTYIAPGAGTVAECLNPALGSSCTPTGSPFTFIQIASNTVVASLQFNGLSYTANSASGTSPTVGLFSTQTAINGTLPDLYALLLGGGSIKGATYAASFVAAQGPSNAPEPSTITLFGLGLLTTGLTVYRRKLCLSNARHTG